MDDVILDRQPVSVVVGKNGNIKLKILGWGYYLYNIMIKGFLIGLLLSLNFSLYVKAGGYSVFSTTYLPNPEVLNIILGIFAVSFFLMIVLSFSDFLQNLLIAVVGGLFVFMMINQFALFDKYDFMTRSFMIYLGEGAANFVSGSCHIIVSIIIGIFTLLYIYFSSTSNKLYLAAALALINVWVLYGAYIKKDNNNNYVYEYDMAAVGNESGKKFITIYLKNAASYNYLTELKDGNTQEDKKINDIQKIMLGFLETNNFDIYNNAYVSHKEAELNEAESINPLIKEGQEIVSSIRNGCCSWQFSPINDKTHSLLESQLLTTFKKAQYKVSAYQGRGLDICYKYGVPQVDRCLNKSSEPADVSLLGSSTSEKIQLLSAQWLESSGLLDSPMISKALGMVSKVFKQPVKKLYVVNSAQALDLAALDIAKDKNNGAYFVYVDLPADMFIYNEFCQVKPIENWVSMQDIKSAEIKNARKAYAEQYACVFGKLQNFIDSLKSKGLEKKSVIVIQGANSMQDREYNKKTERIELGFGANNNVIMAVRDPLRTESTKNQQICKTAEIMASHLFKSVSCKEYKGLGLSEEESKSLKEALGKYTISAETEKKSAEYFKLWYQYWLKANGFDVKVEDKDLEETAEEEQGKDQVLEAVRVIKENKIIDKVIETEAEAPTKSLKAEMLKNPILPEDADIQDKAQSEKAKVDNKAEEGVSEGEALPLGEQTTETKAAGSTPQNETAQPVKGQ